MSILCWFRRRTTDGKRDTGADRVDACERGRAGDTVEAPPGGGPADEVDDVRDGPDFDI